MTRGIVDGEPLAHAGPPHRVRPAGALARLVPGVLAAMIQVLGATLGLRVEGAEKVVPLWNGRRPLIYALWHGRIMMAPWLNAEMRKARGARRVIVLTSRSRDGELLARFVERFGLGVVRGSSSRGGAAAIRVLATTLRDGEDVAIAPDGPRGPAERVQPGLIALAALTDAPIVPLGFAARPVLTIGSWDRFVIPLPFARAAVVFGAPIAVSGDAEREELRQEVEKALADVTAAAERLVGRTS
jgi:hypothetical protein